MNLVRSEVRQGGSEKQFFECSKCDFIETMVVSDPLKSEAIAKLTVSSSRLAEPESLGLYFS